MSTWREILLTGVVIAVPISVVANLLTRPVERRLDRRLETRSAARAARLLAFREEAVELADDQTAFTAVMLAAVLRTAYFGAIAGVVSGACFAAGQVGYQAFEIAGTVFSLLGQISALVGSLLVLRVAGQALQLALEVHRIRTSCSSPTGSANGLLQARTRFLLLLPCRSGTPTISWVTKAGQEYSRVGAPAGEFDHPAALPLNSDIAQPARTRCRTPVALENPHQSNLKWFGHDREDQGSEK
ncbi:MAG: hypothetical protein HY830_23690 [Actinobacteria bacterium]|nr:hypothetical protein [Actinomycetota bacterium]